MNIKEYWIDDIKDIREFEAIDIIENPEMEGLNQVIKNLIDDQFIQTSTERGIARREKMLKITPFADDTLETKRFRVLNRWNEQLPYTYRVLLNKLDQLCGENGYAIVLNSSEYTLSIKIELTKKRMFDEVKIMTRKIAPGNMVITVELRYNQHSKLANYTHAQLAAYKHEQLRNEVII